MFYYTPRGNFHRDEAFNGHRPARDATADATQAQGPALAVCVQLVPTVSLDLWPSVRACCEVSATGCPQRLAAARAQSEKDIEYWLKIGGVWECCTAVLDRIHTDWLSALGKQRRKSSQTSRGGGNDTTLGSKNVLEDVACFDKRILEWATSRDGRADGIRRRTRAKMSTEAWEQACVWLMELDAATIGEHVAHRRLAAETDTLARVSAHLAGAGAQMEAVLRESLQSAQSARRRLLRSVDAEKRARFDQAHTGYLRVDVTVPREQEDAYVRPLEAAATEARARMLECLGRAGSA